jgi:hypothetical protein
MATQIKPTKKNSPAIHHGANRDNLPADSYAGRGKEGYAEFNARPNKSKVDTLDMSVGAYSKSAGDETTKTTGVKIRGTGAATKGVMARGPMA